MTTPDDDGTHCILPAELIERILDSVVILGITKQVLPQFCLSSRTCCALAQPRLFRSVDPTSVANEDHVPISSKKRILLTLSLFRRALRSRPSLKKHVAELVILGDIPNEFIAVLLTLHGLRSLSILGFWRSWPQLGQEARSAFLDHVFPKLLYLKLEDWDSLPFLTLLRSLPNLQTLHLDSPVSHEEAMLTDVARYPQDFRVLHLSNFRPESFEPREPLSYAVRILRVRSLVLYAGGYTDPTAFLPGWLPSYGSWLSELWLDWDFCSRIIGDLEGAEGEEEDPANILSNHSTFDLSSCPALEIFRINLPRCKLSYRGQYEIAAPLFLVAAKIFGYDDKKCRCPRLREFIVLSCPVTLRSADFDLVVVPRAYRELDETLADRRLLPELRRFEASSLSHDIREKNLMPRSTELGILFPTD
ncbi:hypothetical protein DL96DRAFT_1589377 [Flagelloscypha sp. PMI_526]|nr:hypothetical protein DL96DRAFT_1589377 [Flagelloscypha sp. PMI_526]